MSIDISDARPDCANDLGELAGSDPLTRRSNYICRGDGTGDRAGGGCGAIRLSAASAQECAHSTVSSVLSDVNVGYREIRGEILKLQFKGDLIILDRSFELARGV